MQSSTPVQMVVGVVFDGLPTAHPHEGVGDRAVGTAHPDGYLHGREPCAPVGIKERFDRFLKGRHIL